MISFADFNVSIKNAGSLKTNFLKTKFTCVNKKIRCYDQYIYWFLVRMNFNFKRPWSGMNNVKVNALINYGLEQPITLNPWLGFLQSQWTQKNTESIDI